MAFEAETQQRQALEQSLKDLDKFDAENLARKDLGTQLSFEQYVPTFARTLNLFRALSECSLDTVPTQVLSKLVQRANQAKTEFQVIADFSLEKYPNNPIASRTEFGNRIGESYYEHYVHIGPVISYAVRKGTDFARLEAQAKDAVALLDTTVEQNQQALKQKLKDVEATVEKVRRAAQEVGVAQHNLLFNDEAKEYLKSATTWLWITGLLAIATLIAAFGLLSLYLWGSDQFMAKLQSPNLIAVKVVIFGVLISATLWAGRVYRSNQHNYVVNKHRANALSTFETFVKGAGDDQQTKSAVLLQSTQCIFSSQPSGYIAQESDGGMYKQILEIVRGDSGQRGH
ncbi:MAG: hypothetical protein KGJ82_11255 [Nitrospirota bacterium]|nr:hypothetical protein [Nitrospirota bacterium]